MEMHRFFPAGRRLLLAAALASLAAAGRGESGARIQGFDRDPGWDGHNNRSRVPEPREVRQDFGYSRTSHASLPGAPPGEIGGFVTPAAEPASYALPVPDLTLEDRLSASGRVVVGRGGTLDDGAGNTLVGFFHAGTVNEWRTPNSLALRLNGRGDGFHCHVEYATRLWRAGGTFYTRKDPAKPRPETRLIPSGTPHTWSLVYDPRGNGGGGRITVTLNGEELVQDLDPGHKADGAVFNRFGILNVMKSADGGGWLWLDDLKVNGREYSFTSDPGWEGRQNRRAYRTENVRPRFDFGYSRTRHAGGKAPGEIGGLLFRGDERYPERMAYYGDRIGEVNLDRPLEASGRVALRRGVTDSTVLFGYFHSRESMRHSTAQASGVPENFLGAAIEGPSREGFLFYPVYGVDREGAGVAPRFDPLPPRIYPDGRSHAWSLRYQPSPGGGRLTVSLDGQATHLELQPGHRAIGARFDRFGFITTHIDGNGQLVYLDDLSYTAGP